MKSALPNHFLLITADGESVAGKRVAARTLVDWRLRRKQWPLYERTRHLRLFKSGDRVLIYQGGTRQGGRQIVASAVVGSVTSGCIDVQYDPEWVLSSAAVRALLLEKVERFDNPVAISSILGEISILPRLRFWGALLMGGCRMMPPADYHSILSRAAAAKPSSGSPSK